MTPREKVLSDMAESPDRQRAVFARESANGVYTAALAVRTAVGIVSAVIEFPSAKNIPMMILGVLEGLDQGGDPSASAKRFIEIEEAIRTSVAEDVAMPRKPRRNK